MSAPKLVVDLVEHFERDRKVFLSPDYKEEQLRAEFLNPFFTALGWDMDNKQSLFETFKQIIPVEFNCGRRLGYHAPCRLRVTSPVRDPA